MKLNVFWLFHYLHTSQASRFYAHKARGRISSSSKYVCHDFFKRHYLHLRTFVWFSGHCFFFFNLTLKEIQRNELYMEVCAFSFSRLVALAFSGSVGMTLLVLGCALPQPRWVRNGMLCDSTSRNTLGSSFMEQIENRRLSSCRKHGGQSVEGALVAAVIRQRFQHYTMLR